MIPNEHSYCEIDPAKVDQWGIPVLKFHWQWSDYEIKMVQHMHDTFTRPDRNHGRPRHRPIPRSQRSHLEGRPDHSRSRHRRMGDDPKSSV